MHKNAKGILLWVEDEMYENKMSHLLLGGEESNWIIPKFETIYTEFHEVFHDFKCWISLMLSQKTDLTDDFVLNIQLSPKEGYYLIQCHSNVMVDTVWQNLWKSLKLSWMVKSKTLGMAEDIDEASIPFITLHANAKKS